MSKMKAMNMNFLIKDTEMKKKADYNKILAGSGPIKRTLNFGVNKIISFVRVFIRTTLIVQST
jgi:hypothetical protein